MPRNTLFSKTHEVLNLGAKAALVKDDTQVFFINSYLAPD
jgi:hypothetical protein